MTPAYWRVLAAALLPYLFVLYAKAAAAFLEDEKKRRTAACGWRCVGGWVGRGKSSTWR